MGIQIGGSNDNKMTLGGKEYHTHRNKSTLDGITPEKVAQWDAGGGGGDVGEKVEVLNDFSTHEQYPSAKATVDYVKQSAANIYRFRGSIGLDGLYHAQQCGKGTVFNMLDEGTRTFEDANGLGTATYDAGYISFPFPLPGDGFVNVMLATTNMQTYTLANLVQTEYFNDFYHYKDVDGVLADYDGSNELSVAKLTYVLSVRPGDNVVSTGQYWDNLGSCVDLSGKLDEDELSEILDGGIDFLTIKQLLTAYALHIDGDLSHIVVRDGEGNPISLRDVLETKSDKTEIVESGISTPLTLLHNKEYRLGTIPNAFKFDFPETLIDDYIASIDFVTNTTPELSYDVGIHWSGDDISDNTAFVPVANKHYTIVFWYDGTYLNGAVRGVEI